MLASKQSKASLISFLKYMSSLICLVMRLAIHHRMLADKYKLMAAPPIVPKPFCEICASRRFQNFGETPSWNLQTPLPQLVFKFFIFPALWCISQACFGGVNSKTKKRKSQLTCQKLFDPHSKYLLQPNLKRHVQYQEGII